AIVAARWRRTRPPVAMPLEAITIDGWRDATRSADCCGEATIVRRCVAKADTFRRPSDRDRVEVGSPSGRARIDVGALSGRGRVAIGSTSDRLQDPRRARPAAMNKTAMPPRPLDCRRRPVAPECAVRPPAVLANTALLRRARSQTQG